MVNSLFLFLADQRLRYISVSRDDLQVCFCIQRMDWVSNIHEGIARETSPFHLFHCKISHHYFSNECIRLPCTSVHASKQNPASVSL